VEGKMVASRINRMVITVNVQGAILRCTMAGIIERAFTVGKKQITASSYFLSIHKKKWVY
jgi:hypothetical protein